MRDSDAAAEELRFVLSHLARAELLQHRVYPLSRSELPDQLRSIGDSELADLLARSSAETTINSDQLKEILGFARERLSRRQSTN